MMLHLLAPIQPGTERCASGFHPPEEDIGTEANLKLRPVSCRKSLNLVFLAEKGVRNTASGLRSLFSANCPTENGCAIVSVGAVSMSKFGAWLDSRILGGFSEVGS